VRGVNDQEPSSKYQTRLKDQRGNDLNGGVPYVFGTFWDILGHLQQATPPGFGCKVLQIDAWGRTDKETRRNGSKEDEVVKELGGRCAHCGDARLEGPEWNTWDGKVVFGDCQVVEREDDTLLVLRRELAPRRRASATILNVPGSGTTNATPPLAGCS
jgi:hypothetical protein